jgi:hypothetical protein
MRIPAKRRPFPLAIPLAFEGAGIDFIDDDGR